jgi:hypothetical protein
MRLYQVYEEGPLLYMLRNTSEIKKKSLRGSRLIRERDKLRKRRKSAYTAETVGCP